MVGVCVCVGHVTDGCLDLFNIVCISLHSLTMSSTDRRPSKGKGRSLRSASLPFLPF